MNLQSILLIIFYLQLRIIILYLLLFIKYLTLNIYLVLIFKTMFIPLLPKIFKSVAMAVTCNSDHSVHNCYMLLFIITAVCNS